MIKIADNRPQSVPSLWPGWSSLRHGDRGFTLIELVVLLLLLVLVLGLVGLNLESDDTADVREEAKRLALLIRTAQEEAILQGRIFAVAFEARGYHFLRLNDAGSLKPLKRDEILRPRELPSGISIGSIEVDGSTQEKTIGIVIDPSGDVPDFTITLIKGTARWQVTGSIADGIQSTHTFKDRGAS